MSCSVEPCEFRTYLASAIESVDEFEFAYVTAVGVEVRRGLAEELLVRNVRWISGFRHPLHHDDVIAGRLREAFAGGAGGVVQGERLDPRQAGHCESSEVAVAAVVAQQRRSVLQR